MYLGNEMLMATPLAVYAAWRVFSLFRPLALKIAWLVLFLALAAGYPLAESLSHRGGDGWTGAVILVGYYALPLLLYLVLAVIAIDLIIGGLRLTGVLSRATVASRRFRNVRLALSLALPALFVVYGAVNHRVLRVKEYRFEIARRSSTARELTIVFMADLHFRGLTSDRFLDELAAKVNAQHPDIVLVGGDILEGDRRGEDTGRYERAFRRMTSTYGTFAVPGNHEGYTRTAGGGFLERAGIRMLSDEAVPIDRAFTLIGRTDQRRTQSRTPVAQLLAAAPSDLPIVLLVHRPSEFDAAIRGGVAIQLSGHTHHGQLFPANLVTRREYPLSWGHLVKDGTHFFVTSGVQGWGPPVRTVGASEILVLHVALRDGP
jgi:uncharacterized protein